MGFSLDFPAFGGDDMRSFRLEIGLHAGLVDSIGLIS